MSDESLPERLVFMLGLDDRGVATKYFRDLAVLAEPLKAVRNQQIVTGGDPHQELEDKLKKLNTYGVFVVSNALEYNADLSGEHKHESVDPWEVLETTISVAEGRLLEYISTDLRARGIARRSYTAYEDHLAEVAARCYIAMTVLYGKPLEDMKSSLGGLQDAEAKMAENARRAKFRKLEGFLEGQGF